MSFYKNDLLSTYFNDLMYVLVVKIWIKNFDLKIRGFL